jgi:ATP-dependent Clp protease ATP-binding subunit ClpC
MRRSQGVPFQAGPGSRNGARWSDRSIFKRFTPEAHQAVIFAQEEAAQTLRHDYVGSEHILLGLLREPQGLAAEVLKSAGVTLERTREQIIKMIGVGDDPVSGHVPFTPRTKRVLELALREALTLEQDFLDTEHILLGLLDETECVAARLLRDDDIDFEATRAELIAGTLRR